MTGDTEPADKRVRVFVVDDHAVVRAGLAAVLTQFPTTVFVGSAPDGRTALAELATMAGKGALPDVVLMDIVMPDMDGIEVATRIRRVYPTVRIVVLTNYGDVERVHHAMLAGVSGYVLKGSDIEDVATAITAAHRGIVHLDETVARRLLNLVPGGSATTPQLTARERDVLILIARGESSREIAQELAISNRTVQAHTANLFAKLNVTSRTQAALWAIREGLVGPDE